MLTDLQRKKLTRYFRVYDVDDDGRIARPDLERVVENVRALYDVDATSSTYRELRETHLVWWEALRSAADADEDGGVDLAEWLSYWGAVLADDRRYDAEVAAIARSLFGMFDTDGDGVLGADEFCNFYGVYGLKSALARQVFLDLDRDGDGAVSHSELVQMMHEFYRSGDPDAPGNNLFGPTG